MVQTSVSLMHEMAQLLTESEVQNMCTSSLCYDTQYLFTSRPSELSAEHKCYCRTKWVIQVPKQAMLFPPSL